MGVLKGASLVHVHAHTRTYTHTYMYVHTNMCICKHKYNITHPYVRTHTRTHTHTRQPHSTMQWTQGVTTTPNGHKVLHNSSVHSLLLPTLMRAPLPTRRIMSFKALWTALCIITCSNWHHMPSTCDPLSHKGEAIPPKAVAQSPVAL